MSVRSKSAGRAAVASVGCKVSRYDAGLAEKALTAAGYEITAFSEFADIYVINTCAVTNTADRKSRALIKRAAKRNPKALIVAAGCWAQTEPEAAEAAGAGVVLGVNGFESLPQIIGERLGAGVEIPPLNRNAQNIAEKTSPPPSRVRAYLKIQDGCDKFCSYCVIPYARGRSVSRRPEDILAEARSLAEKGAKEIVLTGIHVASYGKDLEKTGLLDICRAVSGVSANVRLRLSSLSPSAVTEEFAAGIRGLNICPHFHLSLQSGSAGVLKRMNRGYAPEDYKRAVLLLKETFPGCAVWSDVIAGFPGESVADFDESLSFIESCGINKLHIFPFSPKKGTRAFDMPKRVDGRTKARRVKALEELDRRLYGKYLNENIGALKRVLFEEYDGEYLTGHTENYIMVKVLGESVVNEYAAVRLERVKETEKGFEVYGVLAEGGGF